MVSEGKDNKAVETINVNNGSRNSEQRKKKHEWTAIRRMKENINEII